MQRHIGDRGTLGTRDPKSVERDRVAAADLEFDPSKGNRFTGILEVCELEIGNWDLGVDVAGFSSTSQ
jgi:hypothetical protein